MLKLHPLKFIVPGDGRLSATSEQTRHAVILGWVVFALIVATFPLTGIWMAFAHEEPYPALTQPFFSETSGAGGIFRGRTVTLSAHRTDGTSVPVPAEKLFKQSGGQAGYVISSLADQPHLDTRSKTALLAEVGKFAPGDIASLEVVIQPVEYRLSENLRYPTSPPKRFLIDLAPADDNTK